MKRRTSSGGSLPVFANRAGAQVVTPTVEMHGPTARLGFRL